ncbi:MAG: glycosyltransferase [Gammaproteobacteria bacterium]|nr:glycosyltransferase [Gammaproteobacteria bacterium]
MKRLLFVTSRFPYPPIGGDRLRVFHLVRLLARRFEVRLLSLGPEAVDAQAIEACRAATGVAEVQCFAQPRWRSLLGAGAALLGGEPLQVGWFRNRALQRAFDDALEQADVVLLHLIRTAALWRRQRPIPAVLDMCDAISMNLRQVQREGKAFAPRTWVAWLEAERVARFERAQAARFDLLSFVAEGDRAALGLNGAGSCVLTQGVDLDAFRFVPPEQRPGRAIALIGKIDTYPNSQAARWAARELMPRLPATLTLKIVGHCPPALRAELEAFPRVQVTGRVDDIQAACADCFAAIAPLSVATGIQNKVLEYFAMGLPSVISPSVARGLLPEAAGCHIEATDVEKWVAALTELDANRSAAAAMALRARRYVEQCHAWDRLGEGFAERIRQTMSASAT